MKKIVVFILAAAMLLSLCACGNKDAADGTKPSETPTTGSTQAPTEGKTDATQPSGENTATTPAPTDPAPTDPPAPTNPPAPTTCSHSWKNATCTAPKTCTKCGATDGNALGHDFKSGTCTRCDAEDKSVPFSNNSWLMDAVNGNLLYRFSLACFTGNGSISVASWSESASGGDAYQFDGKNYYDDGSVKDADITFTEDGDTVKIDVSAEGAVKGTITMKRANATQYSITAVTGTIINESITGALKTGNTFTVFILNIE